MQNIKDKKHEFTEVCYNPRVTRDRLEYMEISHDTLLRYSKSMLENHELLRQIVINKHPYVFIDEYQDTDPLVVDIMQTLDNHSDNTGHDFFVGYYGDDMQNIYSTGIGHEIFNRHANLQVVEKRLNRRSYNEIIDVINKLRNDGIEQRSIYQDLIGGSVKFYYGNREDVDHFIQSYTGRWENHENEQINCLFLTNRSIADYIGISTLYDVMRRANRYNQNFGFELLNTELLSNQFDRLGEVQKTLYNLFSIISIIETKDKTVNNILINKNIENHLTLKDLNSLIIELDRISGNSLGEIIDSIEEIYQSTTEIRFKWLIDKLLCRNKEETFSRKGFLDFILNTLGNLNDGEDLSDDDADEEAENARETLRELLSISKEEFLIWYNYLTKTEEKPVKYHTYHGTKGLEFKNVIIIMENNFGRKPYFDSYFKNRNKSDKDLQKNELKIRREANNLLYVAASRAIKNLRVLYVDNVMEFEKGIEDVFGSVHEY